MVAFNLNWIHFDAQVCRHFVHAIRRHWLSGLIFTLMHLPLTLSLLLASSAMSRLVIGTMPNPSVPSSAITELHARADSPESASAIPAGIYYFFGSGVGLSVICMAIIGMMHRSLDTCERRGVLRLSRANLLSARFAMGLLMALLPFAHNQLTPLSMLGIYVAITAALIIEEAFARVEKTDTEGGEQTETRDESTQT